MIQLLLVGVAAWMAYEAVRAVVPVPPAAQPLLVVAACYGLAKAPPELLAALDAAAVAAVVRAIVARTLGEAPAAALRLPRKSGRPSRPSRLPDLP
ncbi:hypothetical protein ACWDTT_10500 [Streptosporangium sandarakinum]